MHPSEPPPPKVVDRVPLASWLAGQRATRRIVFTNGCFDVLHVGHVRLLRAAREQGDLLVVGLNSDGSVARLKGPQRPLVRQDERAEILAALECVDFVTIFDEATPVETLEIVRPHVHVKGGDYREDDLPETPVLRRIGAEIVIFPLIPGRSTTGLVEKMAAGSGPSHAIH